ncbi:MAG: sugar transferase [Candidatus Omnitrophica bacterium]|nr:sugar transferase [Candidatus Omnitrophota bacterium]
MGKKIQKGFKRIIDILSAFSIIICLLPLLLILAVLIKVTSKGPVFYLSKRVGINGKTFDMVKFRTMVDNAVNIGAGIETYKHDPRITVIGVFLRKWSIDEIPQVFNIIKGDMSFIGPRPALPHQVEKYTAEERKRLEMRPGISGWAQVRGRNLLSWKERIKKDIFYIDNFSLFLDIKIFFMTFWVILSQKGVYGNDGKVKDYE